ncbi:hypothetical protein D3C76_1535180 [compost metagenome]
MKPISMKFTIAHGLLSLGAMALMVLIAWLALRLSGPQLEWFQPARGTAPCFTCWRALLYTLILAGWTAALRLRPAPVDQQRLKDLGLIGFSSIILVELFRV